LGTVLHRAQSGARIIAARKIVFRRNDNEGSTSCIDRFGGRRARNRRRMSHRANELNDHDHR
jgi:hypothetical protein